MSSRQIKAVAADGSATFSHLVEHIDMWQRTSGRQEVRYNSDTDKTVPPGYEEVAKAVGVPLSTVTMNNRGNRGFGALARLKPGATVASAQQELDAQPGQEPLHRVTRTGRAPPAPC